MHHLGVPCISKVKKTKKTLCQDDRIYYLNPQAIVRYEPGGATITPPMLYSTFIRADNELSDLLRKRSFPAKGLATETLSLLLENKVILEDRQTDEKYREMFVEENGLPTQVLLEVTSSCNCDCIMCYHKADLDGYTPPIEDIFRRVRKLKELGIGLFEVTGGEPLLRKDLDKILSYIEDQGLHFYVVTNGEYLKDIDDGLIAVLKRGLGLAVSIDGIGETHNRVRQRPGLYDKVVSGLDFISKKGIKVYLISTLNQENISCIEEMIAVAKRYNTTIHIRPTINTGGAAINKLEKINLADQLKKYLKDENVRNGLLSTKKSIPEARYYGCGTRKRISVSPSGILFSCVMDRSKPMNDIEKYDQKMILGELREETESFLKKHNLCKSCKVNDGKPEPVCGGFCRFSQSYLKGL